MKNEDLLSNIQGARAKALEWGDKERWPMNFSEVDPYFLDIWAKDIFQDLEDFLRDRELKDLSSILKNPSALWEMITHGLQGLSRAGVSQEEQARYAEILVDILRLVKRDDYFCEKGTNLILEPEDIEKTLPNLKPITEESRLIHALCGTLTSYVDSIYFHWDFASREIHGPYKTKEGIVLIRDYFNLRPLEIWPQTATIPYDNLKIIALYRNMDINLDIFNNLYTPSNFIENALKYEITTDGPKGRENMSLKQISELSDILSKVIFEVVQKVESSDSYSKISRYVECAYFAIKPLRETNGKDWHPPKEVLDRLEKLKNV